MNKQTLLKAAKADCIPAGSSGRWFIRKVVLDRSTPAVYRNRPAIIPAGTYTYLYKMTMATMNQEPPGVCIMEDTPQELNTHRAFMMEARGNVLVTGLGLGCVVRGLLANPAVTRLTVIENSQDVLKLVAPYVTGGRHDDRLLVVYADAIAWTKATTQTFDYAWHDLCSTQEDGQLHLDHYHVEMLMNLRGKVGKQGAWNLHRKVKEAVSKLIDWAG